MNKPELSVLMALYNREAYVSEAIESVLHSTFTDFEFIIVDDGSTDKSYSIAESYARKDQRIFLYRNEKNLGQFQNRNKCVEYAKGRYIKYLDSDDLVYPHGLEVMVSSIRKFPDAGASVSFDLSNDKKPYPFLISSENAYLEHFFAKSALTLGPSGIIFRKEAFLAAGAYPCNPFVGSDTEFMLTLAAKYPIVKMSAGLVWWRQHEGQDFAEGHRSDEYLFKNYHMQIKALEDKNCPLSVSDRERAIYKVKQNYARLIWHHALMGRKPMKARRLYKEFGFSFSELIQGLKPYQK